MGMVSHSSFTSAKRSEEGLKEDSGSECPFSIPGSTLLMVGGGSENEGSFSESPPREGSSVKFNAISGLELS